MPLQRLTVSMVDALSEDLQNRLYSGDLKPGEALTEHQVAGHYDVARPTAKAAIEQLVAAGLLVRGVHKTARVPELTVDDVNDIYTTRMLLESTAVRILAQTQNVPQGAVAANTRLTEASNSSIALMIDADMSFHTALIDEIGSSRYSKIYRSIWREIRLCMAQMQGNALLSVQTIHLEHAAILHLIEAGDGREAVRAIEEHIENAKSRLSTFILNFQKQNKGE